MPLRSLATPLALLRPAGLLCSFVLEGEPVPWARARGGEQFGGFYTPQRQRAYKRLLKDFANAGALELGVRSATALAVTLSVRVYVGVPKSWARTNPVKFASAMAGGFCVETPDLDNWIKLPMDVLRERVYVDDRQVVGFPDCGKWHDAARPRLEVDVRLAGGLNVEMGPVACPSL